MEAQDLDFGISPPNGMSSLQAGTEVMTRLTICSLNSGSTI
jgi:hypothetical protein